MATTYAQPPSAPNTSATPNGATTPPSSQNPQLKRIVYSKYRELLGSYNDKANAIIETLPAYMVREDRGFHIEPKATSNDATPTPTPAQSSFKVLQQMVAKVAEQQQWAHNNDTDTDNANDIYGSPAGQREAPACVQNAMMTKDKKPFTYTPGGIDLSQIKSERMAKRLARNAQAEGATGSSQQNRPTQPHSPGSGSPSSSAQAMGAAAMGMPFQVLPPPPPPPAPGMGNKSVNTSAPPPPPPPSANNSTTLAPPANGLKAPGSPNTQRKSPTPQRFEPPPLGFRPEIKIPPNPMAGLRKVPPPVEKNTFWKDEYVKDRSKSPMADSAAPSGAYNGQTNNTNNKSNGYDEYDDGFKKSTTSSVPQRSDANNYTNNNYSQQQQQQQPPQAVSMATPPPPPPAPQTPPQSMQQHQQQSPRPSEFRSVHPPQSPAVNVYTRQTDSPRNEATATPPRSTESPFRYAQQQPQQQQQQQQRAPQAISPLAQQQQQQTQQIQMPSSTAQGQSQAQTVPWRTQRSAQPTTATAQLPTQPHPQPIYNNVQRSPAEQQPQPQYQGPKPTNVGSLYIAPLAPPVEPQAQNIVRQQLQQQQQQQRDSPMRQMQSQQQQPQQQQQQTRTPVRWMTTQPAAKEQPEWVRPEENGNVVPSSLNRMKSPPPPQATSVPIQQQYGNGYPTGQPAMGQNFGSHTGTGTTGLRLQINTNSAANQSAPRERIIPIQLEQTPTYTPSQPNFTTNQTYSNNNNNNNIAPAGYVMRSPNQFVDQGYNNYPSSAPGQQRVMSPTSQLNAPRMIQQQQTQMTNNMGGNKTRVIPIAIEGGDGTRGPISQTPIVIQNDPRSPPIQSKSFRILQKITDTIGDDGNSSSENGNANATANANSAVGEPQLQRPQFARQMSAQQARNSPTIEQMRRMQIGQDQQQATAWNQGNTTSQANKFVQQRPVYNNNDMPPQAYIPPSEQQVPEPKKYTGSAIPSRSFKILQAMTTPENAAEMEDSDCNELNEITNKILSKYNQQNNEQNDNTSITSASNPSPTPQPSTSASSSASSLNSNDSIAYASTPHYPPPYGYPYPYWGPMPNGEQPPPPANWPYPYPGMPMPPPNAQTNPDHPTPYPPYHPYAYYYHPYYPPPPPPLIPQSYNPHQQSPGPQSSNDFDSTQNAQFDPKLYGAPYMPPPYPHTQYPYPVAPSYSQSSSSSRASSVLPDIIVTPSSDETPSQVVMQHHIKVAKPARENSVEIEEISTLTKQCDPPMRREQREGSVIDVLTKRLEDMSTLNMNFSHDIMKEYAGEQDKEFGEKSPIDNASPVHQKVSESDDDDSLSDSSDSEATPKCDKQKVPSTGLQAIKSVSNIQVYKGRQNLDRLGDDDDDDDDDVTTADGESDIFDEDEDEHEHVVDLELDECIEENDDHEYVEEEEDLSTIYEEESEFERTSEYPKTVIQKEDSSVSDATTIEKDDDDDDIAKNVVGNEEDDDSTSVTVRLPLKFSFSRSSNDENIATVEVGKTEERRHSLTLDEKRNSFSIAQIKDESDDERDEEYDDDCEVSVTISLTPSSRSGSADRKSEPYRNAVTAYPIEDLPKPESVATSSSEDVSVSFSLNMKNKLVERTTNGHLQQNITEEPVKEETHKVVDSYSEPPEEMDFFATLRATKLQAQKIKEQSASYWGKSAEKKELDTEDTKTIKETKESERNKEDITITVNRSDKSSQKASLEAAKNDFWATVSEATKDSIEICTREGEEDDFWASIEKTKSSKKKSVKSTQMMCETIKEIPYKINELRMKIDSLPQAQKAAASYIEPEPMEREVEDTVEVAEAEEEEEEDFWASVEQAKAAKSSVERQTEFENLCLPQTEVESEAIEDFWAQEEKNTAPVFDPSKYPEEPREVDTDEEIDFWAEIEAKNKHADTDDVNFYRSATFWANRERNKSIDETPYTPVGTKPFPAKLPDEPSVNIDVWAALEAAKGDEPIIIDPVVEEEKQLAQEFNDMEHDEVFDEEDEEEEEEDQEYTPATVEPMETNIWGDNDDEVMTETASVHEPVVANVWEPANSYVLPQETEMAEQEESVDFWAEIEKQRENETQKSQEIDELEVKRNNYRKAMAFFTTSVDEHKEQSVERFAKSSVSAARTSAVEQQTNEFNKECTPSVVLPYDIDLGPPGEYELVGEEPQITQNGYHVDVDRERDSTSSSSASNSTPTNFEAKLNTDTQKHIQELPEVYVEPTFEPPRKLLSNGLPDLGLEQFSQEPKISVKDRISVFESGSVETPQSKKAELKAQSLSVESCTHPNSTLSRNNSSQRSESEIEEEDSGVTDMNKPLSETDTESESFPELRKMSSYQRAATHSRLFKLLQDDNDEPCPAQIEQERMDEFQLKPSRRKIVHNVSITRKQNPNAVVNAETMSERRERLSLPLRKNTSIDADNPSTPASPASPIMGQPHSNTVVSDKLVNELVQSLLLKSDSTHLRTLPMEKLQAAAKRVLVEELDSLENTSVESTPAITPADHKKDRSYADYYDTWSDASGTSEVVPSKAFRALAEGPKRSPWSVRCPRVLSSKTINRDLARVTESPEIFTRTSKSPDCVTQSSREGSLSRWRKV